MSETLVRQTLVGAGQRITTEVGARGVPGATVLSGSGAPANTLGSDKDLYLDVAGGRTLYGPKVGGAWPLPGYDLKGEPGEDGATSETGGLTMGQHAKLRQLQHYAEGPFDQSCYLVIDPGLFPARSAWYAQLDDKLIYESLVGWLGVLVQSETQRLYAADGVTIVVTVTDTYHYTGLTMTGVTRVVT